jgi:arsenate reductase
MKAREFLAQKKANAAERDLMKQPLNEAEVKALAKRLGGIRELVAPKRRTETESLTDAQLVKKLVDEPNFVRRPLIDIGSDLIAGFTADSRERLAKI